MTKKELAIANHDKGYNCCQAVACAFSKELNVPEDVLFKAGEGFGLGMGCTNGTCGAISGAVMAAGFVNSSGVITNPPTKASTYALSKEIHQKFLEKNGATLCKDLKGIETGKVLRSCPDCIMDAVELVEEVLMNK
ncbi:MAG: C-GCAxxG-C-C family protein [Lachnospiraceae bacterium]|nr:C-GCAxxG-C-C family protein [Lachnospiraceae bacterium]